MRLHILAALAGAGLLAACQSTDYSNQQEAQRKSELAARQGDRVSQICFARNIDSWRPLGRNAVLIRRGLHDWYKLDLAGNCEPEWAISAIGVRSRAAASDCLSVGDHVETDSGASMNASCVITDIYKWNENAPVEPAAH